MSDAIFYESQDVADTVELGRRLGRALRPGDVLALDGELGAGKTQLVRGLALGMGLAGAAVSSPTYVIAHEYLPEPGDAAACPLIHLDAYRITGLDDLDTVGFGPELWADVITVVEWASRVAEYLPPDHLHILLEHGRGPLRQLTFTGRGRWAGRLSDLREKLLP